MDVDFIAIAFGALVVVVALESQATGGAGEESADAELAGLASIRDRGAQEKAGEH